MLLSFQKHDFPPQIKDMAKITQMAKIMKLRVAKTILIRYLMILFNIMKSAYRRISIIIKLCAARKVRASCASPCPNRTCNKQPQTSNSS